MTVPDCVQTRRRRRRQGTLGPQLHPAAERRVSRRSSECTADENARIYLKKVRGQTLERCAPRQSVKCLGSTAARDIMHLDGAGLSTNQRRCQKTNHILHALDMENGLHQRNGFSDLFSSKMKDELRQLQCITYLHRIKIQSCYAVSSLHQNLYERRRPARGSSLILVVLALGGNEEVFRCIQDKKRAI
jgi:hypothetical protein